jgi:hypothetical protein
MKNISKTTGKQPKLKTVMEKFPEIMTIEVRDDDLLDVDLASLPEYVSLMVTPKKHKPVYSFEIMRDEQSLFVTMVINFCECCISDPEQYAEALKSSAITLFAKDESLLCDPEIIFPETIQDSFGFLITWTRDIATESKSLIKDMEIRYRLLKYTAGTMITEKTINQ